MTRKSPVSWSTDSAVRRGAAGGREGGWVCAGGTEEEEEVELPFSSRAKAQACSLLFPISSYTSQHVWHLN